MIPRHFAFGIRFSSSRNPRSLRVFITCTLRELKSDDGPDVKRPPLQKESDRLGVAPCRTVTFPKAP